MMIPTNPEMRRIVEQAHAERSIVMKTLLLKLFTWSPKATERDAPAPKTVATAAA